MTILGLLHRLRVLVAPESYAREVEAEVRFHLELDAMHARGKGLSNEAAEWAARRQFGNVTHVREEVRRMSGMEWIDRVRQDLGYAIRGLVREPGFALAVVLTLGLGLGVNAAMFSFLDRVFVRPPAAVVEPGQVRRLYIDASRPDRRWVYASFKYPHIREIARNIDSTIKLGLFTAPDTASMVSTSSTLHVRRSLANRAYFGVLGVRPVVGRFFDADEDRVESPAAVAVLSHDLWRRAFNGDPGVVGSTVRIGDRPVTIIGVAAEQFTGIELDRSDFWMPLGNYEYGLKRRTPWYESAGTSLMVVTRMPNPAVEQRFTEIASRAYRELYIPDWGIDSIGRIRTGPILSALGPAKQDQEVSISLRLGGVAFIVLLIAIANVSNLLLVRATKRGREIAIRRALGVTRGRLFEQLFTESLLLALIGGAVSIVLAVWAGTALRQVLLPSVNWATGPLDLRTTMFATIGTLAVGILVGLAPAVEAWRPDVVSSLKAGAKGGSYRRSRLRSSLLVAQSALSIVLLVGAGLFVRSLRSVQAIDVGYDVDHTIIASPLSPAGGPVPALNAAMPAILNRLAAIDGVEAVASATTRPMGGDRFISLSLPNRDTLPEVGGVNVSAGYFRAAGVRFLAGRGFSDTDGSGIVVSAAMAKAYWPDESALGKCVIVGDKQGSCTSVIGVVEDVHKFKVIEGPPPPRYYLGAPTARGAIVLRASPERHAAISRLITDEVKRMVPQVAFVRVNSMSTMLEPQFRPWRLGATLFTAMGLLALIVAAIGVYSVIAYAVSQRTNEMGIRVALGAQSSDIARLVIGDGLRTVAIGIGLGVVMSVALGRLVASVLFGISARDPWVITFAAAVLAVIGLAASVIPALRAARVNPVTALRVD